MLSETIDFKATPASLLIEVAPSLFNICKKNDRDERDRLGARGNSFPTTSQAKKSRTTLTDCFKYFTNKEILSDEDLWFCPTCKLLKKASKKIDLWLLPQVLIVQLKRFNYTRYYRDKIDLLVECPLTNLDLSQFVINPSEKANAKYDLIAVSNHMGGLGGGHYTAHAKNVHDKHWHTFDDGYVSNVDEDSVISKSAYVLIYQKRPSEPRPASSRNAAASS